jgi:hypothetical protein
MGTQEFRDYMAWVAHGKVFYLRPHQSLMMEDGVREQLDWESVIRIDGMVKLMLEQYRIKYLPVSTASMQERCRIIEFVLGDPASFHNRLGQEEENEIQAVLPLIRR